jgi:hypothetical protein
MSNPKRDEPSPPAEGEKSASSNQAPSSGSSSNPTFEVDETKPVQELTPEEQMALYEKDLKENDWGHQPC